MERKPIEHATIVVVGPELWSTYAVFNTNAFPEKLASIVESCSLRLGMMLALSSNLQSEVDNEWHQLESELRRDRGGLSKSVQLSQVPVVAFADGLRYLGVLYSFLFASKSFLDVYALLLGKLIDRDNFWTFERAKIEGDVLPGGAIIKKLRKSPSGVFAQSQDLAAQIETHSREWIAECVAYRDAVSHYSEIPRLKNLCIPLRSTSPLFEPNERILPLMPNGRTIPQYANQVLDGVRRLVSDTILIVPDVNRSLIDPARLFERQ